MVKFFIPFLAVYCVFLTRCCLAREYFLEGRAGYFYSTNHRFREVYSNGGGIYGLEFDVQGWKRFFVWSAVNYFHKNGETDQAAGPIVGSGACDLKRGQRRTHITIVPCSLGLKYFITKKPARPYIGAGVLAAYLNTHAKSKHLINKRSKWGVGGIFKSGVLCNVGTHFLIDFFIDYQSLKIDLHRSGHKKVSTHRADISGFSFGGALGYDF